MQKSLTEHLSVVRPFEVRLIFGRRRKKALTDAEVAELSGLTLDIVKKIGNSLSWDNIKTKEVEAFCRACKHDPVRPSESLKYLKRIAMGKITMTHLNATQKTKLFSLYGKLESGNSKEPVTTT